MIFLLLAIVCSTVVGHLFTFASRRGIGSIPLLFVNYAVAVPASLLGMFLHPAPIEIVGLIVPGLALVLGVLFLFNYLMLAEAIKHMGVALPVTLMRVSVAWPVIGSILVFNELPHLPTILATCAIFISLPLAAPEPINKSMLQRARHTGLLQALLLFVATGLTEFLFKVQTELHPLGNPFVFTSMIFPVALVCTWFLYRRKRETLNKTAIISGAALGVFNVMSTVFILLALHLVAGIIVFPVYAAGIIVLSTISGVILWRERPAPRQLAFIVIACLAIAWIYG